MRSHTRRTRAGLALALLQVAACFPTTWGPHYHPTVVAGDQRWHGALCYGGAGASEVLELRGPAGVRLHARLVHGTDIYMQGRLGIFTPAGVTVTLAEPSLALAQSDSGTVTAREWTAPVGALEVNVWSRGEAVPAGSVGPVFGSTKAAFTGTFGGPEAQTAWMHFAVRAGTGERPRRVVLRLPETRVLGAAWDPGPITFTYRARQRGIAPLNC